MLLALKLRQKHLCFKRMVFGYNCLHNIEVIDRAFFSKAKGFGGFSAKNINIKISRSKK